MKRLIAVLCLVLAAFGGAALGPGHGVALADAGGNSAAAHACQNGDYATLMGSDGTRFSNTGQCVSYAAHGGMLGPLTSITITFGPCDGLLVEKTITGTGLYPGSPVMGSFDGPPLFLLGYADSNGNFFIQSEGEAFGTPDYFTGTTAGGQPYTSPTYIEPNCR